jgi:hypothetical protein
MLQRWSILAMLALAAMSLSGCAALGVAASDAAGTPSVPARWVPPREPTLVLVERNYAIAGGDPDCDRLERFINQDLKSHDVAPLVDFQPLATLRETDPDKFGRLSIAALGRMAGAKQVIYVSVLSYGSETPIGSPQAKWSASVKVKVVDATTGQSRWPLDLADGIPMQADSEYQARDETVAYGAVRDILNRNLADKIGKLFHSWEQEHDTAEGYEPESFSP